MPYYWGMLSPKKAREMAKGRWGDSLVCRLVTKDGIQVATCNYNGREFIGRGKSNLSALKAVFNKINK